ncbi:unnamed protein product, partial [Ectocarpus fasciculatus]
KTADRRRCRFPRSAHADNKVRDAGCLWVDEAVSSCMYAEPLHVAAGQGKRSRGHGGHARQRRRTNLSHEKGHMLHPLVHTLQCLHLRRIFGSLGGHDDSELAHHLLA